ncbi:hypothetical protein [Marinomonas rhodophyticola]|uniref:hypothetical protein n=1 Tax=Marinomonas rhodophyticola TaxID=2992803 RepID=UPI0032049F8A
MGKLLQRLVILAAADSVLGALGSALDQIIAFYGTDDGWDITRLPSVRLANWMQLIKPAAFDLYEHKVLDHAKVVVVSLLGGEHYWTYGFQRLQEWAQAKAGRTLIFVPVMRPMILLSPMLLMPVQKTVTECGATCVKVGK